MTAQEAAAGLVGMLAAAGLAARVHDSRQPNGAQWVVIDPVPGEPEPLFEVTDVEPDRVYCLTMRLGRTKQLRARTVRAAERTALARRCAEIAARVKEHAANREADSKARAVAEELRGLGMNAEAKRGRVVITLDLSPEYAAEVGPKIAAVMSERKG